MWKKIFVLMKIDFFVIGTDHYEREHERRRAVDNLIIHTSILIAI